MVIGLTGSLNLVIALAVFF